MLLSEMPFPSPFSERFRIGRLTQSNAAYTTNPWMLIIQSSA